MSGGTVRSLLAALAALCVLPSIADATPLVVAGFTFEAGERPRFPLFGTHGERVGTRMTTGTMNGRLE
jgi:hypothetical protein